jgi:hypothetical protein
MRRARRKAMKQQSDERQKIKQGRLPFGCGGPRTAQQTGCTSRREPSKFGCLAEDPKSILAVNV